MTKTLLALATAGLVGAASLPASAQTGRIDPGVGAANLPITQVQYRGGHRWQHGGSGWRHGGPGWHNGGGWRGGYGWRHHRRGFGVGAGVAGLAAGALIGGAIASQAAPVYGAPVYGPPVDYAAPPPDDNTVAYCMQRFKSYNPATGTYLGYDGLRHPCP